MRTAHSVTLRRTVALASLVVFAACGDNGTEPVQPASIAPVGNATFSGTVGQALGAPLTVRVTDTNGNPIPGQAVTFSVVDGGGSVSPTSTTTNGNGEATSSWQLGPTPGQQRAQAQVTGVSGAASFVAVAAAGDPATIAVQAGNNQSSPAGAAVAVAPAVLLRDQFGNPVPGVSVFFSVTAGGGSVTGAGATTNAEGIATVGGWQLGSSLGVNRLTALAVFNGVQGNPVEFTATAVAGAANALNALTSATITAPVGSNVTPLPSVRVVDAGGNPVAGVQVTFAASTGSTVTGAVKSSNADGIATVDGWQLGTTAQTYTLTATATGVSTPVVFTASARAAQAGSVAVQAGNNQSAIVGRPVTVEPSVRVTDGFGNPVSGIEVVFEVTGGGGFAVARTPVTNANGIATVGGWTLGENPGANTLRATVSGSGITNNPITFVATATPGEPATMVAQAGNNQTAAAGAAVPVAPAVLVRDNRGNPVSGVVVQFIIGTGSGTLTGADAITNASGIATLGAWTLGPAAGTQTLLARLPGLPDVTFAATAVPGAPSQVQAVTTLNRGQQPVNSVIAPAPSVRVRDAGGNPVEGAQVTFQLVAGSGGSITGATQSTNADGVATLGSWQLGQLANVTASVRVFVTGLDLQGAEPVFTANVVAGPAAALAVAPGSVQNQVGQTAGAAVTVVPAVRVTDAFGNSVSGASVSFVAAGGNGTVVGSPSTSNANGVATITSWTMPAGPGVRSLTVTVTGTTIPAVVFTATVP